MLNHKTIKTILTITAVCLVSLARAEEPVFEFKYSEEEAKLYRMPIKQITPKDGIWTGHVIAYGHYIKPPYKIEVKDTIVFINNVQVYPALKTPGMIEKEKKDAEEREVRKKAVQEYIKSHQDEYNDMQRIDSLAKQLYEKEKASKGKEAAVNAVMDYYRKCEGVDNVEINSLNGGEIDVIYKPGTIQYELLRIKGFKRPERRTIRFEPYGKCETAPDIYKTPEERDADMRRMGFPTTKQGWAEPWAKRYEELLRDGWVQFFGVDGKDNLTEAKLLEVYEIMDDNKTSQSDKYSKLRGILTHMEILAVIANYNSKEWKTIRRER